MSVTDGPAGRARVARSSRHAPLPGLGVPSRVVARPLAGLRLAVLVRWRAAGLDRELAAGVSPLTSDALAVRARRITGRRSRATVANGLARVVRSASDAGARFTAAVAPDRREVLAARAVIDALECRLRGREAITARGMAMLRDLLTDPTSPLYRPDKPGALGSRLRSAAAALEPTRRWE